MASSGFGRGFHRVASFSAPASRAPRAPTDKKARPPIRRTRQERAHGDPRLPLRKTSQEALYDKWFSPTAAQPKATSGSPAPEPNPAPSLCRPAAPQVELTSDERALVEATAHHRAIRWLRLCEPEVYGPADRLEAPPGMRRLMLVTAGDAVRVYRSRTKEAADHYLALRFSLSAKTGRPRRWLRRERTVAAATAGHPLFANLVADDDLETASAASVLVFRQSPLGTLGEVVTRLRNELGIEMDHGLIALFTRQLTEALGFMHDVLGRVHGNLTADNVWVAADDRVQLADFRASRRLAKHRSATKGKRRNSKRADRQRAKTRPDLVAMARINLLMCTGTLPGYTRAALLEAAHGQSEPHVDFIRQLLAEPPPLCADLLQHPYLAPSRDGCGFDAATAL